MNLLDTWGDTGSDGINDDGSGPEVVANDTAGYRPPEWAGQPDDVNQLVYVRSNIGGYFFDAIMRTEHTSNLKITSHPVQTGANIVDHAYLEPATVVMEVAMSDAMSSLVTGQYASTPSKSVAAYEALLKLQEARLPLQVVTRLHTYQNMLIEELSAPDDVKTCYGLRCSVTLKEIFVVEVSKTTVSARPQTSGNSNRGQQSAAAPPPTILRQGEKTLKGES